MSYKADELLVVKMDNFLWLFFVSQIHENYLTIVWYEALVYHQGVIDLYCLRLKFNHSCWISAMLRHFIPVELLFINMAISVLI